MQIIDQNCTAGFDENVSSPVIEVVPVGSCSVTQDRQINSNLVKLSLGTLLWFLGCAEMIGGDVHR